MQSLAPKYNVWSQISRGDHERKVVGKVREVSTHLERLGEVVSHKVGNHFQHTVMPSIVPPQL